MFECAPLNAGVVGDSNPPAAPTLEVVPEALGRIAALHLRGQLRESLRELDNLPPEVRNIPAAQFIRARILMDLQEYEEAARSWEEFHSIAAGDAGSRRAQAHCYQHVGRWEDAAALFQGVLGEAPEDQEALLALGLCQLQLKQYEDTVSNLTRYLEAQPGNASARFALAVAYQMLWEAEEAVRLYEGLLEENLHPAEALGNLIAIYRQQNDIEQLRRTSARLLHLDPESMIGLEGAAYAAFQSEDYGTGAELCVDLVQVDGSRYERWMNLALCRRKLGQAETALVAYEEAVRRRADLSEAHIQIVSILMESKQDEQALRMAERGIENCPDADDLYQLLGTIHENSGNPDQAEVVFETLVGRKPGNAVGWFRLGNMRLARSAYESAAEAYETCLSLNEDWPDVELNLSIVYSELNKQSEALQLLDGVLTRKPNWEPALRVAAVASLKLGALEQSLNYHERLIECGHADPAVYFNAALLAEQIRGAESAVGYYEKSVELRSDFVDALVNLGHALDSLGRRDEARQRWAQAMELKPELASDYFRIPC